MTENEWLTIGLKNGVIELCRDSEEFLGVYKQWFLMKMNHVKPQTLDRIECTYNKHYKGSDMEHRKMHEIDTAYHLSGCLSGMLIQYGQLTRKEFKRIYQIANNVLAFAWC